MLRLVFAKRYTERSMRSLLIYSLTPNPVICFTLLYKDALAHGHGICQVLDR